MQKRAVAQERTYGIQYRKLKPGIREQAVSKEESQGEDSNRKVPT